MKKYLLMLSLIALSACATLTAEGDQVVTIKTVPPGADCTVSNSLGRYTIPATPNTITVPRAFEPLDVICTLPGYTPAQTSIQSGTRGRAYGNILLLGFPAIVDMSTGKGYSYEEETTLTFSPAEPPAVPVTGPVLRPKEE